MFDFHEKNSNLYNLPITYFILSNGRPLENKRVKT